MTEPGLRARKKAATRAEIADAAARLFGRHGYEDVTVAAVAREAGYALQTVYNYFPTKQDLVLDRAEEMREDLVRLVVQRPPGVTPVAAVRGYVQGELTRLESRSAQQAAGELPALSAASATIRRLTLEARDEQARALAAAIVETTPGTEPLVARAHAAAVMSVLQAVVDETGPRLREGAEPSDVAAELLPTVRAALDDLERRLV